MDFSNSKIEYLIIHEVGNKLRDEKYFLSTNTQTIDENLVSFFSKLKLWNSNASPIIGPRKNAGANVIGKPDA